ncbi:MAG TPA: flagellar motor switch protein FliN [Candidatus Dormibacteraeota bacterium]|nr:flagellar motor switch protein FliN [Candidatus Dormibacteraeota bacterium]
MADSNPQLKALATAISRAGAEALGTLLDRAVRVGEPLASASSESIRLEADRVAATAEVPALAAPLVVRFSKGDLARCVDLMVGGTGEPQDEIPAMQLSIVAETAGQLASAMAATLAEEVGLTAEGTKAGVVEDAGALPAPPFVSFAVPLEIEGILSGSFSIDVPALLANRVTEQATSRFHAQASPEVRERARAPVHAKPAEFAPMAPTAPLMPSPGSANLDLVHDIPLQISAVLGQARMPLREVVSLTPGSVFELEKSNAEPIDLYVNNILIARGEVVVVDDKFAVKISELNPGDRA